MRSGLLSLGLGLVGLSLLACSSTVTTTFGEGGAGGDGGGGATGPGSGPTSGTGQNGTTVGPGASTTGPGGSVNASTSTGNPATGSVSVVSGSTSSGMTCDLGSCDTCIDCSINTTCSASYEACFSDMECLAFVQCVEDCQNQSNPDACYQQCFEVYPTGAQLYQEAVFCIVCDSCFQSCDGAGAGC